MENNASHILDIHTHKSEDASHGRAIINFPLPVDDSLCLSASDVRTAGKEGYFYSAGINAGRIEISLFTCRPDIRSRQAQRIIHR